MLYLPVSHVGPGTVFGFQAENLGSAATVALFSISSPAPPGHGVGSRKADLRRPRSGRAHVLLSLSSVVSNQIDMVFRAPSHQVRAIPKALARAGLVVNLDPSRQT